MAVDAEPGPAADARDPGRTELVDLLDRIIVGGVAITTRALSSSALGRDLTLPQWRVLLVVGDQEGGATITAVAKRIGVTLPATSRQLHRLAGRGLVRFERDSVDRRAMRVQLTDDGVRVRVLILTVRRTRIAAIVASVDVLGDTGTVLDRLADAFDAER